MTRIDTTKQTQNAPATRPVRLLYDSTYTDVRPARQLVFGELVKLAIPVIRAYHSDLFHDAMWLDTYLSGREKTFYWSVDESGTTIGPKAVGLRQNAYRVTVTNNDGRIEMKAEPYAKRP